MSSFTQQCSVLKRPTFDRERHWQASEMKLHDQITTRTPAWAIEKSLRNCPRCSRIASVTLVYPSDAFFSMMLFRERSMNDCWLHLPHAGGSRLAEAGVPRHGRPVASFGTADPPPTAGSRQETLPEVFRHEPVHYGVYAAAMPTQCDFRRASVKISAESGRSGIRRSRSGGFGRIDFGINDS